MISNSTKKLISPYISELYMNKKNYIEVYELLEICTNTETLSTLYSEFYKKNCLNCGVSEEEFVNKLVSISEKFICPEDEELLEAKSVFKNFIKEYKKQDNYNFEKMIYPLFLFTKNLYFELIKNNAKRVFFFAREGQFMKKLFDAFMSKTPGFKIKTEYLYVSRGSTFLGTLLSLDKETFDSLFIQYPNMSIETFLKNLNFNDNEIENIRKSLDMDLSIIIDNIKASKEFKELIQCEYFVKVYDEKRKYSKKNFLEYLNQFDIEREDTIHIVDVGWKGSIQNNIQKMLAGRKIQGYYLGLVHYGEVDDYEKKTPVLFEYTNARISCNGYLYNGNRPFFEIFLDADHGSTVNYNKNGDLVEPVLNNQKKELVMFNKHIKPIQENMFEKYNKLLDILKYSFYDNKSIEKKINNKFFLLNFKPTSLEAEEFNSFYHYENFGVMNYSNFKKVERLGFIDKIKKYLKFHDYIRNDETWQYLKLYNADMKLGKIVLYYYKKAVMKKHDII